MQVRAAEVSTRSGPSYLVIIVSTVLSAPAATRPRRHFSTGLPYLAVSGCHDRCQQGHIAPRLPLAPHRHRFGRTSAAPQFRQPCSITEALLASWRRWRRR
jgi:hypothetical protein